MDKIAKEDVLAKSTTEENWQSTPGPDNAIFFYMCPCTCAVVRKVYLKADAHILLLWACAARLCKLVGVQN
jgi:hypothetical protein